MNNQFSDQMIGTNETKKNHTSSQKANVTYRSLNPTKNKSLLKTVILELQNRVTDDGERKELNLEYAEQL